VLDLLWPLIQAVPQAERTGALVKAYGEPIRTRSYRKWFREIAKTAKISDSVWNMDARAGAVTEALEAGAEKTAVQRAATHASAAMTERYDRTAETAPLAVAEARSRARRTRSG
jgi:site-specific recombinase XerD